MKSIKNALPTSHTVKTSVNTAIPKTHINPAYERKPAQLPLRPLQPNRFVPPRGQKQVFLPKFTITLLRTPLKPPHFASFLVPLNLNKLDLKSYLYNAYNVRVLHVRSFIIHGRVVRDQKTGRLRRMPRKKKMTIEMEGSKAAFVWPDAPEDLGPWDVKVKEEEAKKKEELKKGTTVDGLQLGLVLEAERNTLKKQAKALLAGEVRWRPGLQEFQTGADSRRPMASAQKST